jgi:hypothetical protein
MANSYVFYPNATGSTTDYSVPFEYLSQTFVKATVNGASVPFTFLSTYMIRFTTAPVGALKIYRQTSKAPVNTYINGSILVDSQLNGSFLQSLHVSEEVADNAMQVATDGSWDATNLKIKNVATPTNAGDAVSKSYLDTRFDADKVIVDAAKVAAATSAAAALASQNAAATSASNAATSKTGADTAKVGADTAKAGADTAKAGADTAKAGADTAKAAAETARDLAQKWANEVEDTPVSGGQFSAFHWARKALGYVTGSISNAVHGSTAKNTPVAADEFLIVDSAASWGLKKIDWNALTLRIQNYLAAVATTWTAAQTFNNTVTITAQTGQALGLGTDPGTSTTLRARSASGAGSASFMTFDRPGLYFANFGIDTDNKWKVGGLSMGANAYEIVHMGNLSIADTRWVRKDAETAINAGVGYIASSFHDITGSGTLTLTQTGGNFKYLHNAGAFTLAKDAANGASCYTLYIYMNNVAGAGAITLSGFSAITGDALDTTVGSTFGITIVKFGAVSTINILKVS